MDSVIAVAAINGTVAVVGSVLTYLGLRHRIDKKHDEVASQVTVATDKIDQAKDINAIQIQTSNNFNQKIQKLTEQSEYHSRQGAMLLSKVDRIERNVKQLSDGTGITIGE